MVAARYWKSDDLANADPQLVDGQRRPSLRGRHSTTRSVSTHSDPFTNLHIFTTPDGFRSTLTGRGVPLSTRAALNQPDGIQPQARARQMPFDHRLLFDQQFNLLRPDAAVDLS